MRSSQSPTARTIALAMENASTTRAFAKTIGEAKIALELFVQIIAVTLVLVGRKCANATTDIPDNLVRCTEVIRKGISKLKF